MNKRTIDEMIAYFNQEVSKMDIAQEYKMALLGMITAIGYESKKQEVVRCKDCIHWSNDSIGYCKYHEIYPSRHDLDDFFCADGERKENRNEID